MNENNNMKNSQANSHRNHGDDEMQILGVVPCAPKQPKHQEDDKMTLDVERYNAWLDKDDTSAPHFRREFLVWGLIVGVEPDPTAQPEDGQSFQFEVLVFEDPSEEPLLGQFTFAENPSGDKGSLYDLLLWWKPDVFPHDCPNISHLVGQKVLMNVTYREDGAPLFQFYHPDDLKSLVFDEVFVNDWLRKQRRQKR